jgi:hypothetical protein
MPPPTPLTPRARKAELDFADAFLRHHIGEWVGMNLAFTVMGVIIGLGIWKASAAAMQRCVARSKEKRSAGPRGGVLRREASYE